MKEPDPMERTQSSVYLRDPLSSSPSNIQNGTIHKVGSQELDDLATHREIIICCGPGGVGKTTISAAFGLRAALLGRRACVVTVDPARRLASALGIDSLPNVPILVEGNWPGELHALMLDTKGTFDDLITHYAQNIEQAESIRNNRLYQNLATALSGTQEYMAMEKLYELVSSNNFDVVIVDTPPTRNALDLLDAPRRLTHFLENRIFKALLLPTKAYFKALTFATQALLKTISKVAGAEIVQDAVTFFQAFQGMEEGFHARATSVRALLKDPNTAYILVTSPRPDAVEETVFFAEKLASTGVEPAGIVANRVHPHFIGDTGKTLLNDLDDMRKKLGSSDLGKIIENLIDLESIAQHEEATYANLLRHAVSTPIGVLPLLESDVHDLKGLSVMANCLFQVSTNSSD